MNELDLFKGGMPSYMKGAALDETTRSLMGSGGGGGLKRISFKGNLFRMIANGEEVTTNEDRAMNIVIVKAAPGVSRTYYEGQYREGENSSPVCWSAEGQRPDPKSPAPQSSKCETCPQNIKGSGQGDAKACRYNRKLAIVLDGDMDGDVYQISLAATSIFGKGENGKLPLEAYARYLATHNVSATAVVTEMRFDPKSPVPKLTFRAVRGLSEAEWESCRAQAETTDAAEAIAHTFVVKAKDESEKAAPATRAKAITKPKPAPVEDEETTEEPVKVGSKKAAVSAEKKELDDLLDEWADS